MCSSDLAGEAQVAKRCRRRRKDGSLIDIRISTAPLRNAQGLITGTIKIVSDISEVKGKLQQNRNFKSDGAQPFWMRYVRIPHITNK